MDIEQLLESVALGSDSAANCLLEHHRDRLKRMVEMRMDNRLRSRFDASDVVQEALTVAAKRLAGFAAQRPMPFYPWVRKLTWEQLVKMHEKHAAAKRAVDRDRPLYPALTSGSVNVLADQIAKSQTSGPVQKLLRKEARRRTRAALEMLPETDREILEMKYLEQLENIEIAALLEISEGAVRVRHFRALKRVQAYLADGSSGNIP